MKRDKLISLRNKMGLTQKEVVKLLKEQYNIDITASFYGMIERGVRNPTLNLAIAIAELFNSSIEEIFFCGTNNDMLNKKKDQQPA